MNGPSDQGNLTEQEIAEGWHFCWDWDGLLIGTGMGELDSCSCYSKDHPVYSTAPPKTSPD